MDYLYGPLGKDWCVYFYFFSIYYFLSIFITSFLFIRYYMGKTIKSPISIYIVIGMVFNIIVSILFYIQMRILHGMCINSIK